MRHSKILLALAGIWATSQTGCGGDNSGMTPNDASVARDMIVNVPDSGTSNDGAISRNDASAGDAGSSTPPGECGAATVSSAIGTAVFSGLVAETPNRFEPSCNDFDPENSPSGGEVLFRWQAPSTGRYRFDTEGTEIDTVMWIVPDGADACGEGATELGCNDDEEIDEIGFWSLLELDVTAGDTLQILVEGYLADEDQGPVRVNVSSL
jgi:hypothetical protein